MKVAQGLLQADPSFVDSKDYMLRLWAHECKRCFSDRFIQDSSRDDDAFSEILSTIVRKHFSYDLPPFNHNSIKNEGEILFTSINNESLEDFVVDGYKEIQKKEELLPVISKMLNAYNEHDSLTPMRLVLFDEALMHISRIHRIIQMRAGHALLIGVGGSGRESLTRLASFISKYHFSLVRVSSGRADFLEDIKLI